MRIKYYVRLNDTREIGIDTIYNYDLLQLID